jgi:D-sedoheptulose 7-phosphate isomerase
MNLFPEFNVLIVLKWASERYSEQSTPSNGRYFAVSLTDVVPEFSLSPIALDQEQRVVNFMEHWIQDYIAAQHKALESIQPSDIAQAYATLQEAWRHSRGIFIIGNGGNAANGSHFATDLGKGASDVLGRRFRVMSMADNTAWMTAIGNDYSYEETFTRQLQNFAKPGDVLIASSVSGNSPNLVHACEWAVQSGLETIALVGGKRGRLAEVAKQTIVIGDTHYGRVEDVQMHILHMLCYAFMDLKPAVPIEVAHPFAARPDIQHVIFDFDGTLSLVREGWPVVMTSLFRDCLAKPTLPSTK